MRKHFTIANFFTFLRIILTPLFIYFLFAKGPYFEIFALLIFVAASVTDAYDGYFARKYSSVSNLGAFLDPLADKILMSAAFLSFVFLDLFPLWMVILIILRDFLITGIRIIFSRNNINFVTRKNAKIKTGVQIGLICFVLVYQITQRWHIFDPIKDEIANYMVHDHSIIYYLILLVTLFTVWTGIEYFWVNRKKFKYIFSR
ncbi:MAG: CDP-diacylglycerol--glycerol-3-phosphate 3-phosphatidyltransferase [Candidatus Marinimicrobia bacterium]|nr:CDP-diacylglycerol--glycerol-3-phosphate 3-phosphatidyltransferase [Candidatus Neomarinimicrobiota bacterium]